MTKDDAAIWWLLNYQDGMSTNINRLLVDHFVASPHLLDRLFANLHDIGAKL